LPGSLKAANGGTGVPIDDDPFRRRGTGQGQTGKQRKQQSAKGRTRNAVSLSLPPCCGHSVGERWDDSH
jgi:hypothetical protein